MYTQSCSSSLRQWDFFFVTTDAAAVVCTPPSHDLTPSQSYPSQPCDSYHIDVLFFFPSGTTIRALFYRVKASGIV